jgi:glutaminase
MDDEALDERVRGSGVRPGSNPGMRAHDSTPGETPTEVSTGALPDLDRVQEVVALAHSTYLDVHDGHVADYIPALAEASPDLFGIAIVGVRGRAGGIGDSTHPFTIQSVVKPFLFALVCDALGHREVRERLGVNATGLPFDSVMAVEIAADGLTNPLVNSGAIATTSLAPGDTAEEKWQFLLEGLSRFAGRDLEVDQVVLDSERASNGRNEAMARLMAGHGRLYFDPDESTDVYTRLCSLQVTAVDLATMGATLADGGVNPVTLRPVVSPDTCRRTLAVMLTAGLYELSGDWLYEIGLPAKSGVSGGIVTVAPGKGGLATFSPPLDAAGNSVRGQLATKLISESLGLDLLVSRPFEGPDPAGA